MSGLLAGKICLIAGTTGIGGATAHRFGQEGARIIAVGRNKDHSAQLASALQADNVDCLVLAEDLTSAGAADRVLAAVLSRFGRIDVLFHVAGISGRHQGDGPLHQCSDAGWDVVVATNLGAMMKLNRACVQHWLETKATGVILNMASVLGFSFATEHFDTVAYASAKAAIIGMSLHAAACYAKNGIRVNVLAPGLVDTPMAARATRDLAIQSFLKRKQPLTQAPLTDTDCANAALFLCSDLSAHVTGVVLPVDGGWTVSG